MKSLLHLFLVISGAMCYAQSEDFYNADVLLYKSGNMKPARGVVKMIDYKLAIVVNHRMCLNFFKHFL